MPTDSSTTPRKWYVVATFYADTPDDDIKADDYADMITSAVQRTLGAIPGGHDGSVDVQECDWLAEGWVVQTRTIREEE